jgi:RHS repeat-associated protein
VVSSNGAQPSREKFEKGLATRVTNASGTILEDCDYFPYGGSVCTPSSINNYLFTGKERDSESGLDDFGARYYASQYGRFMTPDRPVDQHTVNPQSMNLYSYVRNNPVTYTDPSGNFDCKLNDEACGHAILADIKIRQAASDINNPNMFALQRVSDALGTYNDHNGLTIQSGDLGARAANGSYTAAKTTPDGKTMTFNNNKDVPRMGIDAFAVTMVHEGTHVMQDNQRLNSGLQFTGALGSLFGRLGGGGPMSKDNLYRIEYEAYQNQGYMEEYLHIPMGIYDPTLKGEAEMKHMQQQVGGYAEVDAEKECGALAGCKP